MHGLRLELRLGLKLRLNSLLKLERSLGLSGEHGVGFSLDGLLNHGLDLSHLLRLEFSLSSNHSVCHGVGLSHSSLLDLVDSCKDLLGLHRRLNNPLSLGSPLKLCRSLLDDLERSGLRLFDQLGHSLHHGLAHECRLDLFDYLGLRNGLHEGLRLRLRLERRRGIIQHLELRVLGIEVTRSRIRALFRSRDLGILGLDGELHVLALFVQAERALVCRRLRLFEGLELVDSLLDEALLEGLLDIRVVFEHLVLRKHVKVVEVLENGSLVLLIGIKRFLVSEEGLAHEGVGNGNGGLLGQLRILRALRHALDASHDLVLRSLSSNGLVISLEGRHVLREGGVSNSLGLVREHVVVAQRLVVLEGLVRKREVVSTLNGRHDVREVRGGVLAHCRLGIVLKVVAVIRGVLGVKPETVLTLVVYVRLLIGLEVPGLLRHVIVCGELLANLREALLERREEALAASGSDASLVFGGALAATERARPVRTLDAVPAQHVEAIFAAGHLGRLLRTHGAADHLRLVVDDLAARGEDAQRGEHVGTVADALDLLIDLGDNLRRGLGLLLGILHEARHGSGCAGLVDDQGLACGRAAQLVVVLSLPVAVLVVLSVFVVLVILVVFVLVFLRLRRHDEHLAVTLGSVLLGTDLRHHAEHGGHARLVVVGTVGARGEAHVDGLDAEGKQGQDAHEPDDPHHAARGTRHERQRLEDGGEAGDAQEHGSDAAQQGKDARKGARAQEALARRVIVRHDHDGTVALGDQRALGAVHADDILAAGARTHAAQQV